MLPEHLVVTTLTGELRLLDPGSGATLVTEDLREPVGTPPVAHGDRLLVTTHEGRVISFSVEEGAR